VPDEEGRRGHQLPAVHLVFSNLRRVMEGAHAHVSGERMQAFLDVFSFRFNHREDLLGGVRRVLRGLVDVGPVLYGEVRCQGSAEIP
jgi:hypothetical protein